MLSKHRDILLAWFWNAYYAHMWIVRRFFSWTHNFSLHASCDGLKSLLFKLFVWKIASILKNTYILSTQHNGTTLLNVKLPISVSLHIWTDICTVNFWQDSFFDFQFQFLSFCLYKGKCDRISFGVRKYALVQQM